MTGQEVSALKHRATLESERLARLRETMAGRSIPAVLTADPINIFYATGVRNMTVFSMMGPSRFALVTVDGPVVVWECPGAEHLAASSDATTEVRTAPGVSPMAGSSYLASIEDLVVQIHQLVPVVEGRRSLAVERFDHPVTDALRSADFDLQSATEVFVAARLIKLPGEIRAMESNMKSVMSGVAAMRNQLQPGRSEVEVWAELHRSLIADNGEYVSTRLAQTGSRTFPYFKEAGTTKVAEGDLFCIDTDAIGPGGYGVDFSRTFMCGHSAPTGRQRSLHGLALAQLTHNAALLEPGRTFESFAAEAWMVPHHYAPYRYYCLAHGLGLSGEFPYLPTHDPSIPYPVTGRFEPGMVICVESYIGDPDSHQGVKLEDQFLITDVGARRMSVMSLDLV